MVRRSGARPTLWLGAGHGDGARGLLQSVENLGDGTVDVQPVALVQVGRAPASRNASGRATGKQMGLGDSSSSPSALAAGVTLCQFLARPRNRRKRGAAPAVTDGQWSVISWDRQPETHLQADLEVSDIALGGVATDLGHFERVEICHRCRSTSDAVADRCVDVSEDVPTISDTRYT